MITPARFHNSMSMDDLISALNYNFGQIENQSANDTVKEKTVRYASIISSNFTVASSRFSTTSTSVVDIPNASFTFKSPGYKVKVLAIYSVMATSYPANSYVIFTVDNVQKGQEMYVDVGSPWVRASSTATFEVDAGQEVTLKLRGYVASGSTLSVTNEEEKWKPSISLVVVPA